MLIRKIIPYSPIFQRRLRDNEKTEYTRDTIKEAYKFLGVKDVAMVMHGTCFPVTENDLGVGSPFNSASKDVIKLLELHGFTSGQQGPLGDISKRHISPYESAIWAKNRLFIDMNALATDEYANILNKSDIAVCAVKYDDNSTPYTYSKFYEAFENYDKLLDKAYENFKTKVRMKEQKALKLNDEFLVYKAKNKSRLLKETLFKILSNMYGTEDFEKWENPIDRNLPSLLAQKNIEALERYKYLMNSKGCEADTYAFSQFLANKQANEHRKFRQSIGFKYISDEPIGTQKMDEYLYKDAFIPNVKMGCPEGGNYGPQFWNFPVPDPKKLFNPNGSLGIAGLYIKNKLVDALNSCENIRIDHVIGLIDPFVYYKDSVEINNGRLNYQKFVGKNISQMPELDPNQDYRKILEKIVLPVFEERGINPQDVVWEDIGNLSPTVDDIFHKKLNLPGLTVLQYSRAEDSHNPHNWSYIGAHDSEPVQMMVENPDVINSYAWNNLYLAGYLNYDQSRKSERDMLANKIESDNMERLKAKFAELFTSSDKIQISFADFFGIKKVYNYGGKSSKTNWKLRLNKNYEDEYYKNLSSDNPTAINLPEILKLAVRAKMDMLIVAHAKSNPYDIDMFRKSLNSKMQPLLNRLDKFAGIFKEKE